MTRSLGLDLSAIYGLIDPRSGLIAYVGKSDTPVRRLHLHKLEARNPNAKNYNTRKSYWIRKLWSLNLEPEMIILAWVPRSKWRQAECAWIDYFIRSGLDLVNTAAGGGGAPTPVVTEATKAKIRLAVAKAKSEGRIKGSTGYKFTEEQRKRLSESHMGGPGNPGYKHTAESIAKIKAARARQEAAGNPWLVHGGKV